MQPCYSVGVSCIAQLKTRWLPEFRYERWTFSDFQILFLFYFFQRLRRLWRRAQIRGFLSLDLKFPLTDAEAMTITKQEFLDLITDEHFKSREDPMLQSNKLDAMIQLYSNVPMHLLNQLQKLFETDCILFGYDPKPDIVFRRDILRSSPFKYFDLIKVR